MTGLKMAEEAQEQRLADRIRAFGVGNLVAVVFMVLIGAGLLWPGMIVSFAESVGLPTSELPYGRDLRTFIAAGELAAERSGDLIYDRTAGAYVEAGSTDSRFVNPPWYAMLMIPLTWFSFPLVFAAWTAAGLAAGLVALRRLCTSRAELVAGAALLTAAATLTIWYGQNTFFMVALLALAILALERGAYTTSGIAFGFLAFKPHLFLGFAVWLVLDFKRMVRVAIPAIVTSLVLFAVSAIWLPGAWVEFLAAVVSDESLANDARELSLLSSVRLLFVGYPAFVVTGSALVIILVIVGLGFGIRWSSADARIAGGLAIIASLLIAPHVVTYDWLLLVVALALLAWRPIAHRSSVVGSGAALACILVIGFFITDAQLDAFGRAIHLAPIALAAVFAGALVMVQRISVSGEVSVDSP
ncbi:MAG: glycosyltransferase family 87 protein [Acidimicrobiia bacterium]